MVLRKALGQNKSTTMETVLDRFVVSPRRILKLPMNFFTLGELADLAILDPKEEWVFKQSHVKSRSKNSPFYGSQLLGRVKGVINRSHAVDFGAFTK